MVDLSRDTNTTARRAYRECHRFVVLFTSTIASNIFSTGLAGIDGHAVFYHRGGSSLLKKKKKNTAHLQRNYTFSSIQQC